MGHDDIEELIRRALVAPQPIARGSSEHDLNDNGHGEGYSEVGMEQDILVLACRDGSSCSWDRDGGCHHHAPPMELLIEGHVPEKAHREDSEWHQDAPRRKHADSMEAISSEPGFPVSIAASARYSRSG